MRVRNMIGLLLLPCLTVFIIEYHHIDIDEGATNKLV